MKTWCVAMCMLVMVTTVSATSKFVRTSGANSNDGKTWTTAWQTIGYANTQVRAGDTLYIAQGTYSDCISPVASGAAGNPIVYQPYQGSVVTVRPGQGNDGANITNKSYIVIRNLRFVETNYAVYLSQCDNVTVEGNVIYDRSAWAAIKLVNVTYSRIVHNYVDPADTVQRPGENGDGIQLDSGCHHNLLYGNFVTRCYHTAIGLEMSATIHHNVIDSNIIYLNHNGIDGSGMANVIQNNKMWKSNGVFGRGGNAIGGKGASRNIFRFNLVVDDSCNPSAELNDRPVATFGTWSGTGSSTGNRIYHNTFYFANDEPTVQRCPVWVANDGGTAADSIHDLKVYNNIFYRSVNGAPLVDQRDWNRRAVDFSAAWDGNLFRKDTGKVFVRIRGNDIAAEYALSDAKRLFPSIWRPGNIDAAMEFIDEGKRDLRPIVGSAAVDRAVHLCAAMSSGAASTSLRVDDSFWFTDGYGITQADSIKIEGSPAVRVASIDYATHTITLSSSRTWANGARIWLYRMDKFAGAAPDVGALECLGDNRTSKGANVILNPAFESGESGWTFFGDTPSFFLVDSSESVRGLVGHVVIGQTGMNQQLYQSGITLVNGRDYVLHFKARSNHERVLAVSVKRHSPPFEGYGLSNSEVALQSNWGEHECRFTASLPGGTMNDARIMFSFAGFAGGGDEYFIDDVELYSFTPSTVSQPELTPVLVRLEQNYPNPFNPSTRIAFSLPQAGHALLTIYDVIGRKVATLADGYLVGGEHSAIFDGKGLSSGVYFCELVFGNSRQLRKMSLMK
jgi:hypothetical protein